MDYTRPAAFELLIVVLAIGLSACVPSAVAAEVFEETAPAADALARYYSGNGFLSRGLHELAIPEYDAFLAAHPDHEKAPIARYGLAISFYRLGRHAEAIEHLLRLKDDASLPYACDVNTVLGQCLMAVEQHEEALQSFDEARRHCRRHELEDDASGGGVEAAYRLTRHDEVLSRSRRFLEAWPRSPLRDRIEFLWASSLTIQGDYAEAARHLGALLDGFPESPLTDQALLLLAQCQHRLGLLEEALVTYRRVLQGAQTQVQPDALLGLGTVALQRGEHDEAAKWLDRLLEQSPNRELTESARFHRARVFFETGQFDRARELFRTVRTSKGAFEAEAAYWLAKCALSESQYARAAEELSEAVADYPDQLARAEVRYDQAMASAQAGRNDDARRLLRTFAEDFAGHELIPHAMYMLALSEHRLTRYEDARDAARRLLDDYPSHSLAARAWMLVGESEFQLEHYAEAVSAFRRTLAAGLEGPDVDKAKFRLGSGLYQLDRTNEAQPLLEQIASGKREDVDFSTAYVLLGEIHFDRSEWKPAAECFGAYVASGQDPGLVVEALLKRGLALQRSGEHKEALAAYDDLIARSSKGPMRLRAMFERGQVLVSLSRVEDAASQFEEVLQQDGDSELKPLTLKHLGDLAMQREDYDAAAKYFGRVKSNGAPSDAEALLAEGRALLAAGDYEEARRKFAGFLDKHSTHARASEASAYQAIAISRTDQYDEALKAIERTEPRYGRSLDEGLRRAVNYEQAWCLRKLGRTSEAAKIYRAVASQEGDDDATLHALLDLALIESQAERFDTARQLLLRLRKSFTSRGSGVPESLREAGIYQSAVCAFELEGFQEAANLFEEFIGQFPASSRLSEAGYYCGEALFALGKFESAAAHLTRVAAEFPDAETYGPTLLRLGECLARLQRWSRSEQVLADYLDRFGESAPQWYQAQFGLAWAREHQGRLDEAVDAYQVIVTRHKGPTAARAQFQIGECLFAKKDYKAAVRELLRVDILYAYPEWSAAALYEAGRCFEKLGQNVEARAQFKAVAERHADTQWAKLADKHLAEALTGNIPGHAGTKQPQ